MVVETSSATGIEQRNQAIKEDIKHLLEEIWDCEPDEPFNKTLSREAKKYVHRVMHNSKA